MSRWYLSGGISNVPNYREKFKRAELWLRLQGESVINPCDFDFLRESGFKYSDFMLLDYKLIEMSDGIYMISGWEKSKGACAELSYAKMLGKKIKFESKQWRLKKGNDK